MPFAVIFMVSSRSDDVARSLAPGLGVRNRAPQAAAVTPDALERDGGGMNDGRDSHGVAVFEVTVALAELRDLGRADEREVHGPEENDLPAAGMTLARDLLELLALLQAHGDLQGEHGELVADSQHRVTPFVCCSSDAASTLIGLRQCIDERDSV
jgi:hypothetical protein